MTSFIVFHGTIRDGAAFQRYAQAVGPTLTKHGGEVLLRGKAAAVLAGDHDDGIVGILGFPDPNAAAEWYRSAAYQALVPLRDEGASMTAILYEAPPS